MKFTSTPIPNLLRAANLTYYARIVHQRKQHWRTLRTKKLHVARQRLRVEEEEVRGRRVTKGVEMTWRQAADLYAMKVAGMGLAPASVKSRLQASATLRRIVPALEDRDVSTVTAHDLRAILANLGGFVPRGAKTPAKGDSPTNYNRLITYFCGVMGVAVENGLVAKNPAAGLQRKSPGKKLLVLPSRDQFAQIVSHIRALPVGGPDSANVVTGMAYSGARVEEVGALEWADVDWSRKQIAIGGTKTNSARRWVPMNPALQTLLERMRPPGMPTGDVFRRKECLRSLASACKAVGVKKLTHHDLRHYFATVCIESGVDIPTVANWMGHADGGALAMRTYGHLRAQHSADAAAKVTF